MLREWHELERELDRWSDAGRTATFWWRDDDAVEMTSPLRLLLDLTGARGIPVALAVVPRPAAPGLRTQLAGAAVSVLQHGWCHRSHAPETERKAELGDHRPLEEIGAELESGLRRLSEIFGPSFLPVLVPPWNRIGRAVKERLPRWGYTALSTFGQRCSIGDGLLRINAHVDPIDWRGTRGFRGTGPVLAQALAHLAARRTGNADPCEATGLLTHHLVHDGETWRFLQEFALRVAGHPAVRWLEPRELIERRRAGLH